MCQLLPRTDRNEGISFWTNFLTKLQPLLKLHFDFESVRAADPEVTLGTCHPNHFTTSPQKIPKFRSHLEYLRSFRSMRGIKLDASDITSRPICVVSIPSSYDDLQYD